MECIHSTFHWNTPFHCFTATPGHSECALTSFAVTSLRYAFKVSLATIFPPTAAWIAIYKQENNISNCFFSFLYKSLMTTMYLVFPFHLFQLVSTKFGHWCYFPSACPHHHYILFPATWTILYIHCFCFSLCAQFHPAGFNIFKN